MARAKQLAVPQVGEEAPEFHLPSAQGGQLRLSMRTARGPVVVAFYSGEWSAEDVAYFKDLATKEEEINMAAGSLVGIGLSEPAEARDFVRETGIKSYVLYDYAGVATREYGLLEKDKEHGQYARPATFIVDSDHRVAHAWVGERPKAEEVLAKVSEITGLPKLAEEESAEGETGAEKPKRAKAGKTGEGEAGESGTGERKRLSPEEREKSRAERQAAREKGGAKSGGKPENGQGGEKADGE